MNYESSKYKVKPIFDTICYSIQVFIHNWKLFSIQIITGPSCSLLTSISTQSGEGNPFFRWAGTVGDLHLQLVPRRLLQVVQDVALGEWRALSCGPGGRVHSSVFQNEGGDRTATIVPTGQVEPGSGGVDAGKEFMFFGKLGLWWEKKTREHYKILTRIQKNIFSCVFPKFRRI